MEQYDLSNTYFKLAADFINNTTRHVFLTGKAGTGKTTFLKYIKQHSKKNTVVVAPTGVAAINAGGVTMHSFFQLPFGPFIPATNKGFINNDITDKHSLFTNIRFNADKRELLQELELLIIDEISMVRADMLDAMDTILRHFRRKPSLPFGGVQVLYIGDMYQLPPVVANNEWDILQPYYESPFFFSAKAVAEIPPLYIELKKIYRQNEQVFIDVLNRVRNNMVTDKDFELLNSKYQPNFNPNKDDKYITLSTHNKRADNINTNELAKLTGKAFLFDGVITGDFSDKALPTEMTLQLKEGAQIIFIKNDAGTERKYFNGKLATIKSIKNDEIIVISNNDTTEIKVEKEIWKNVRYTYSKESDSIQEEELGSFSQYPIKLAWAITVHKSQGLTFDKAIIDAGASFAAGQVYVALSRCTSLSGLVLQSKILPSAIATDKRVIAFAQKEAAAEQLQQLLKNEQQQYLSESLIKTFNWKKIMDQMQLFASISHSKKIPDVNIELLTTSLINKAKEQGQIAVKFQQQLQQLLLSVYENSETTFLEDRVSKAIPYFIKAIGNDLLTPLEAHVVILKQTPKLKKHIKEVVAIVAFLRQHMQRILQTTYGDIIFCKDNNIYKPYEVAVQAISNIKKENKPRSIKGGSQLESLNLFKSGKTIEEIANLRQITESTVISHLTTFIRTGDLDIHLLMPIEKLNHILPVVKEVGGHAITPIKERLSDDISYSDIRIVLNYWHRLEEQKVNA